MKSRSMLMAGATAILATVWSMPALAQTAANTAATPDNGQRQDGDIIVTAQRRAESLNDVGMSVQAVDGDTLEQLRVNDLRDLSAVRHIDCRHLCR